MHAISNGELRALAEECVANMGDVFWDFDSGRDTKAGYSDPYNVAVNTVERSLKDLATKIAPGATGDLA